MKIVFILFFCFSVLISFGQQADNVKRPVQLTKNQAAYIMYMVDHADLPHLEVEREKEFLADLFDKAFADNPKQDSTEKKDIPIIPKKK